MPPPASSSAQALRRRRFLKPVLEDDSLDLPWPLVRDPALIESLRNRRRSRCHVAAISTDGRVGSISETLSVASSPSPSLRDAHQTDADLTLPLLSPMAPSFAAQSSPDRPYFPGQPKSLAGIAVRSFCLGAALAAGLIGTLTVLVFTRSPLWRLPFFAASLATFHFLEFCITAMYNTRAAEVDAFLLTANWPLQAIAHAAAAVECLVVGAFFPRRSWVPFPGCGALVLLLGLMFVVAGQTVRSAAMVQAGPSFNHQMQRRRRDDHVLVTTGIYSRLRHPSYFGFFWWALGTQMVLGNVVCFFLWGATLWHFFSSRVRAEEELLVNFFGNDYVEYRKRVGTKIPLV